MNTFFRLVKFDLKRLIKNPILYCGILISFFVLVFNHGMFVSSAFESQAEYEEAMGYLSYEEFQNSDKEAFIKEKTGSDVIPVYEDYMTPEERVELEDDYAEYFSTQDYSSLEEELIKLDEEGKVVFYGMYDAEQLEQMDSATYEKTIHSMFGPYAWTTRFSTRKVTESGSVYAENPPYSQAQEVGQERAEVENYSQPYSRQMIRISMMFMSVTSFLLLIQICKDDIHNKRVAFFRGTNVKVWKYCLSKITSVSFASFIGVFLSTFFIFLYDYLQLYDLEWGFAFVDYFFYLLVIAVFSLLFINCLTMFVLYLSKNQLITIVVLFIVTYIGAYPGDSNSIVWPYGMRLYRCVPSINESLWGVDVTRLYIAHQLFYLGISVLLFMGCKMKLSNFINYGKKE